MTEFFDKLRVDRKLDEALSIMKEISDPIISSRIQGIVALHFSDVPLDKIVLSEMLAPDHKAAVSAQPSGFIEAVHPVAQGLPVHAADPSGAGSVHAV
jgi:hypothetical protein